MEDTFVIFARPAWVIPVPGSTSSLIVGVPLDSLPVISYEGSYLLVSISGWKSGSPTSCWPAKTDWRDIYFTRFTILYRQHNCDAGPSPSNRRSGRDESQQVVACLPVAEERGIQKCPSSCSQRNPAPLRRHICKKKQASARPRAKSGQDDSDVEAGQFRSSPRKREL